MVNQILCGAAERIVTPPIGLSMPGYFGPRFTTGKKDDLYTQAVVIDDGKNAVAILSIDIVDFKPRLVKQIRAGVERALGFSLPVMAVATHAHTASPTNYSCLESPKNDKHVAFLVNSSVESVKEAYMRRVPVKVGVAVGEESRISFCRNFYMEDGSIVTNPGRARAHLAKAPVSAIDHSVTVLRFDDFNGKTISRIVNFACHPDCVGGMEYCADYVGELRRRVKEESGEDSVLVFLNGCAGDVNHVDAMRYKNEPNFLFSPEHYKWMGKCLAESVFASEKSISFEEDPRVSVLSHTFREARRQPTEGEIADAVRVMEAPEKFSIDRRIYAKERLGLCKHPRLFVNVEIQAIRIGSVGISCLPGEIFSEIGLAIKKESPFEKNIVAELANGTHGYLVTEPCFSAGVYEAKLARDNSYFPPQTADKMRDVALMLLNKLAKKVN